MESRFTYVRKNLIWSIANNVIATVMPFIVRTLMVRYMGSEYLGLNSLCTSILFVLNAVDFGMGNAFLYSMYRPIAKHEDDVVCAMLRFFGKVYSILGLVVAVLGLSMLPFIKLFVRGSIPDNTNIYIVFFVYLLNTVLTYVYFGCYDLIICATQRKDLGCIASIISVGFMYTLQIVFVLSGSYYFYVIAIPISTMLGNTIRYCFVRQRFPQYVCRGEVSYSFKERLKTDVKAVAVYRLRDASRTTFDSIFISAICGLMSVACYQNYYMVMTVPILLRNILISSIAPSFGNYVVLETKEASFDIFMKISFAYLFISGLFAICYYQLIQEFTVLWVGEDNLLGSKSVILFVIEFYLLGLLELTKMVRETVGLWSFGKKFIVIEMLVNFSLNFVLVHLWGIEGVLLATVFSLLFIAIPAEEGAVFLNYFCGKMSVFMVEVIKNIVWIIVTGTIVKFVCRYVVEGGLVSLALSTCVCIIVPTCSFVVLYHKSPNYQYYKQLIAKRLNVNVDYADK